MVDNIFGGLKITVEDSSTTGGSVGGASGGSRSGSANTTIAKAVSLGTGVASATQELVQMVKEAVNGVLKPVRSIIVGTLKLLAQLLRPISDMVVLLLMPILQFLRPIIKVFNDMMRPFRTAAYQLMRAAGKETDPLKKANIMSLAMTAILTGLNVGLIAVIGELVKFFISIIASIIGQIVQFVTFGLVHAEDVANAITGTVNTFIDDSMKTLQITALTGIRGLADGLGIDLNANIQSGINKAFANIKIPENFGQQQSKSSSVPGGTTILYQGKYETADFSSGYNSSSLFTANNFLTMAKSSGSINNSHTNTSGGGGGGGAG